MAEGGTIIRLFTAALESILFTSLAGQETTLFLLTALMATTGFTRAVELVMTIWMHKAAWETIISIWMVERAMIP